MSENSSITREGEEAPSVRDGEEVGRLERVRHVKRGTEYEVLGEAEAQVATGHRDINDMTYTDIQDGSRITVYRCMKTGKLWTRLTDEFRDGRFETIAASPHPDDKTAGMTVEEAREALQGILNPDGFARSLRTLASQPECHPAHRADLIVQANKLEAALLTLQSDRGDQE